MTKPKTLAGPARSLDTDWPPHQPIAGEHYNGDGNEAEPGIRCSLEYVIPVLLEKLRAAERAEREAGLPRQRRVSGIASRRSVSDNDRERRLMKAAAATPRQQEEPQPSDAYDGRVTVGDDRLLARLVEVHGEPRYDLAPGITAANASATR